MPEETRDLSTAYLRAHGHKSKFHIAKAFDMKADEVVAAGSYEGHPAVEHLRNQAELHRLVPENN